MHSLKPTLPAVLSVGLSTCLAIAASSAAWADTAPVKNGVSQVAITLTDKDGGACLIDHDSAKAGPVTFSVTNKSATAITELELQQNNRILGEKENLAPGLPTVAFTVTLGGGSYTLYCPGAKKAMVDFKVTGKAAARPTGSTAKILKEGTEGYAKYVNETVDAMLVAVKKLKSDIDAGKLDEAKKEYALARPFYERIESDVDGFMLPGFDVTDNHGNLDYLIDMRKSNMDPAVGWHGFHAIERDLFKDGKITDGTKKLAAELVKNVTTLDGLVRKLSYMPEDLGNGAAGLLEEVQNTKISGEEELYSHIDLVDFAGNVEGAQQAFAYLEPGMKKIDPQLAAQVDEQFAKVRTLLDTYRDPSLAGGYILYTDKVKAADKVKLSKAIQSLQEPLARIAEKVATVQ